MGELMKRPSQQEKEIVIRGFEQIEKDQLDDPITFAVYLNFLKDLNAMSTERRCYQRWAELTRHLIREGKGAFLLVQLDEEIYNISDEQNDEDKLPEVIKSQEKEQVKYVNSKYGMEIASLVRDGYKITEVAMKYGLKVKANKCICPFHADSDPSMSLYDRTGTFHCFGCQEHGNILSFINKMEALKNGQSAGSEEEAR